MSEDHPKHPYVTEQNAKVHLTFSIAVGIMSVIQIILGIVISELEIKEIVSRWSDFSRGDSGMPRWYNDSSLDEWFFGDHVYVGGAGIILALLGFSVYRTRSRSNGVMLSVMCFLCCFIVYPVALILGGVLYKDTFFVHSIPAVRTASSVYTAIQAVVIVVWAIYTSLHTCCNPNVKRETRLNVQAASGFPPQQVVYVPQQVAQYPQQPPQYSSPDKPPAYAE
ncbi:hypothetical protein ACHWQZ_G009515 [Mnemiopsis leidyi]